MLKRTIITFLLLIFLVPTPNIAFSADDDDTGFTRLTTVDLNTFNEYRYRITEQFFDLRSKFEIEGSVDKTVASKILDIAKKGYNYLPDNLANKNVYNKLKTSVERGIKYPDNEGNYTSIVTGIQSYLEDVQIQKITGKVEAFPSTGNAPLTVTFRGNVKDPTGTKIPAHNYIWWMDVGGKRKILQNSKGTSLNYTFKEEGNFSVFLDVVSDHKNAGGYTDVLPFRSRADIKVKEKVASVIIKVNGLSLRQKDELKFTPEEANYGLLFDATSSTPTSGTKFLKTEWEFGNGVVKEYEGPPKIERIIYNGEGEYRVKLKLKTNEGKTTERKFDIVVHDPIASIKSNLEEGFLGDKFTFSAENQINDDNLTYSWEIIDIEEDEIIFRKTGSLFTYAFTKKGKYNLRLIVREPSSNIPDIDTQIIHINSRAPEAFFKSSIPLRSKPNTVLLDATKSFDPDFSDEGKLTFAWVINGQRVQLDNPNYNGSIGNYTFDSIGDHSVVLEVTDPDGITVQKKDKVRVDSILSVEFFAFPRVVQREQRIDFNADSPEAKFFEWNFGDGEIKGGKSEKISHTYKESGVFPVVLKVVDEDDNVNTFTKNVYVGESNSPYAFITLKNPSNSEILFRNDACDGKGAYIVNRVDSIKFSGEESIDITGRSNGLSYSWKLDSDTFYSSNTFRKKFDELGCFPVQLKVKSDKNGRTSTRSVWVKVENEKPTLSSLDVNVIDDSSDPVIVKVNALGAQDRDGVIQSYLWYYYTDIDAEPQDFRATKDPETTFVLPKITGNYYFVVLMKDNNEARITSEEITGSKYFITLAGDNINTPLIKLKANKRSVTIGEEIIFTASAENILGQDISKKAKYSWDLDGDGFYEKETNSPTTSYKFVYSGETHSKVKVKYKGFSSTKSITIGVANILKPDFSYISIGKQFILLDKSTGKYDTIQWDLGDDTEVSKKQSFIHEYSDDESSHFVELEIAEGGKVRTIKKKVLKNLKNFILSRKEPLVVFSDPVIESNKITLEAAENVYIFLKSNSGTTLSYAVDFDTGNDSDLNGGVDDDEDVSGEFSSGSSLPVLIKLGKQKNQNVKVTTKNASGAIVDSYGFAIEKLYIDEEIDIKTIKFNGISESERVKIEKLKDYVNSLPKEHKLKALMYVQKLQEEWFDNREKTNVILEFENYITEVDPGGAEYAINLLESLLVEGQEDQSEKSIIFNALKNLLPQTISCEALGEELGEESCYDALIAKLEVIKENSIVDENRALGTQILKVVAVDKTMTNKQKTDFKAILKTFVYGGVQNIPAEEIKEVIEEDKGGKDVFGLIKTIFLWIFIILGVFVLISIGYYIYYKLVNKDPNIGFQDFIIDRTSGRKSGKIKQDVSEKEDLEDILGTMNDDDTGNTEEAKTVENEEQKIEDNAGKNIVEPEVQEKDTPKEEKREIPVSEAPQSDFKAEEVPDWLKGSMASEDNVSDTPEENIANQDAVSEEKNTSNDSVEEKKSEVQESPDKEEKLPEDIAKVDDTNIPSDSVGDEKVPDWLKGSFGDEETKEPKGDEANTDKNNIQEEVSQKPQNSGFDTPVEEKVDTSFEEQIPPEASAPLEKREDEKLPKNEDLEEITKIEDESGEEENNIPDWLKGSFTKTEESSKKEEKTKNSKNEEKVGETLKSEEKVSEDDGIPSWLKSSFGDEEKKKDNKEDNEGKITSESEGKEKDIPKKEENLVEEKKEETPNVKEVPTEENKEEIIEDESAEEEKKGEELENTVEEGIQKELSESEIPKTEEKPVEEAKEENQKETQTKGKELEENTGTSEHIEKQEKQEKKKPRRKKKKSPKRDEDTSGAAQDTKKQEENKREEKTIAKNSIGEEAKKTGDEKESQKIEKKKQPNEAKKDTKLKEVRKDDSKTLPKEAKEKIDDKRNEEKSQTKDKNDEKQKNTKTDEDQKSDKKNDSDSDLWDDGMKIPDWLKTDDEK